MKVYDLLCGQWKIVQNWADFYEGIGAEIPVQRINPNLLWWSGVVFGLILGIYGFSLGNKN